jgi:hypothetical protein
MVLRKRIFPLLFSVLIGLFVVSGFLGFVSRVRASAIPQLENAPVVDAPSLTQTQQTLHLPIAMKNYPSLKMFGVEALPLTLQGGNVLSYTKSLPAQWVRLNGRISWRTLQPVKGGPILWDHLSSFELELRNLRAASITPIVIVDDYPSWATDNTVRVDKQSTSCGKLTDEGIANFAAFMTEIVNHYSTVEFNVRNWELGNEPDVDPNLVSPNSEFGCWGDFYDPYYGGEAYGRMIIQVGAAIKAADPWAQVWLGGLLLDAPYPTGIYGEHPELFLAGVLRSGAAPYFDVVPYHWYPSYGEQRVIDFDISSSTWMTMGGGTVGKARYLRQQMQAYGVSKPVFLNETAFGCPYDIRYPDWFIWCKNPTEAFFDLQASYIVRSATRAYNENISGYIWYTMNGPGWRSGGLLDGTQAPKLVYQSYVYLIRQFQNSHVIGPVSYATGIEAYAFDRGTDRLDILWAIEDQTITVTVPIADWIGAFQRDGTSIFPAQDGSNYLVPIGFSPVYLVRKR